MLVEIHPFFPGDPPETTLLGCCHLTKSKPESTGDGSKSSLHSTEILKRIFNDDEFSGMHNTRCGGNQNKSQGSGVITLPEEDDLEDEDNFDEECMSEEQHTSEVIWRCLERVREHVMSGRQGSSSSRERSRSGSLDRSKTENVLGEPMTLDPESP